MKEKTENDMKKEIKKLQHLRNFFRQAISSGEIKDKSKLQEAKRRIEDQMENFRELEKEYKSRKLTKVSYQTSNELEGKFMYESDEGSDSNDPYGDYGSDCSEEEQKRPGKGTNDSESDSEEFADEHAAKMQFFVLLATEIKDFQTKLENEINTIRSLRKGSLKKNKERINQIMTRIAAMKQVRDRADELQIGLDYLEARRMRRLRKLGSEYTKNPEDETLR